MDKKHVGLAAILLAKKPSKDEKPETEETEEVSGHEALAEEMLAAQKKGDAAAYADALKSFIEMCSVDDEEAETEE